MYMPSNTKIVADASLSVLKQPSSVTSEVNQQVSFFVGATGKCITFQWQELKGSEWVDIPKANAMKMTLTAMKSSEYRCVISDSNGESIVSDVVSLTVQYPPFGIPDFILPDNLQHIESNAFEGIDANTVAVPATCAYIGDYAFSNSGVQRIRIPEQCILGQNVFDGCELVCIYGTKGSDAERYSANHENCIFIEE